MRRGVVVPSSLKVDIDLHTGISVLAGRHIVFMGDSVIRYQAIALIYALHFRRWPMRHRGAPCACIPVFCFIATQHTLNQLRLQQYATAVPLSAHRTHAHSAPL